MKAKELKIYEVTCPDCKHKFKTEKSKDIQCYGCGKRFGI